MGNCCTDQNDAYQTLVDKDNVDKVTVRGSKVTIRYQKVRPYDSLWKMYKGVRFETPAVTAYGTIEENILFPFVIENSFDKDFLILDSFYEPLILKCDTVLTAKPNKFNTCDLGKFYNACRELKTVDWSSQNSLKFIVVFLH